MKLFGTMQNVDGVLHIGGISAPELVKQYGTPLFVYDEALIRKNARDFQGYLKNDHFKTEVLYAGKAFSCVQMAKLAAEEGLSMDVVSGGEIATVHKAGFPMERVYFHGNNKLDRELDYAMECRVGTIVVDHDEEVDRVSKLAGEKSIQQHVLLRVNPGIEAHTHAYIQTAHNDSKFGVSIFSEETLDTIRKMAEDPNLMFDGLHCHVGSQIFETQSFVDAAKAMLEYRHEVYAKTGIMAKRLNLGGGFGVYYTEEDKPFELEDFFQDLIEGILDKCQELDDPVPEILIEPGRSIVNNACVTLYTVGSVKNTVSGKNYAAIDGGMTDNIRPALYQAKYECALANRMNDPAEDIYTLAGKLCESGDKVVENAPLPVPVRGDIAVVASTGAYGYAMASNYNRMERPEVIFVKDGKSRTVIHRETYEDLLRKDVL